MIALPFIHAFAVASRSGRAVAVLGEADMERAEDDGRTAGEIIRDFAAVAHPEMDRERHMMLRHGLESALVICERVPGNVSLAAVRLDDGRKAVVLRHVKGDDAVAGLLARGMRMEEDEQWTSSDGTTRARPL